MEAGQNAIVVTLSEPLLFDTYLRAQIWGGAGLSAYLGKVAGSKKRIGEAWELSTLAEHTNRVVTGSFAGSSLSELWQHFRNDLAGEDAWTDEFPWLVKWLDCHDALSLQVHPDDSMARAVLGQPHGKSEVWVVIHAGTQAEVSIGLRPEVTQSDFESHLAAGTVRQCLHSYVPCAGDCIFLPAGTLHTARDLILAEIQQPSDATFRLFDWNRYDNAGHARSLDPIRGLQAIDWRQGPIDPVKPHAFSTNQVGVHAETLVTSSWIHLERFRVERRWPSPYHGEMIVWMIVKGEVQLINTKTGLSHTLSCGATILVPAAADSLEWIPIPTNSAVELLCVRRP